MNCLDGICKFKSCDISEITESEMEDCAWNDDCENCEMNTASDSYDKHND